MALMFSVSSMASAFDGIDVTDIEGISLAELREDDLREIEEVDLAELDEEEYLTEAAASAIDPPANGTITLSGPSEFSKTWTDVPLTPIIDAGTQYGYVFGSYNHSSKQVRASCFGTNGKLKAALIISSGNHTNTGYGTVVDSNYIGLSNNNAIFYGDVYFR